ncbi:MAG: hypothetical protein GTO18_16090 [Anaerolineales bacterium]|nr:hypothetical protein [Anaerolineales bacterium]
MRQDRKLHPVTWMIWVASASIVTLLTRNPFYLLILTLIAIAVRWAATREPPKSWVLKLYMSMLIFPAMLNLVFSRAGETILLELEIPIIGGPYTLEALLFGTSAGVQIATLLLIMVIFNDLISAQDLLRRTPSGLYQVGVAASISLTFAPQARGAFSSLREAQQIRGYQPKGLRDLPKVVTPLVILSLERAFGIAESLATRDWIHPGLGGWRRRLAGVGWLGLAASLCLWVVFSSNPLPAIVLLLVSLVALWVGHRTGLKRFQYRPDIWRVRDSIVVGVSIGAMLVILVISIGAPGLLTYYPYPELSVPGFEVVIALAITLLSIPALVGGND